MERFTDRQSSSYSTKRLTRKSTFKLHSTVGISELIRKNNNSESRTISNNEVFKHSKQKSIDSMISESYSSRLGGSLNKSTSSLNNNRRLKEINRINQENIRLITFINYFNRLVNTLSNTKPNICIKDIKSHEKTQKYYKNLASKLNNSPSNQHKIIEKVFVLIGCIYLLYLAKYT